MHHDDLKEKDEFILFFKIVHGKIASAARNWIILGDTADLSRPFAALLLRAVAILQTEETNLA